MNISCLVGRHELSAWKLRPRLIGARVEWLRWERDCVRQDVAKRWRCSHVERRWFRVFVPKSFVPRGKAIDVEEYLRKIHAHAPKPETLTTSHSPPADAIASLTK